MDNYVTARLRTRLLLGMGAAIVFNAIYCLIYRYSMGDPATLFEAFSWGTIHIAPWVAAFEIGRMTESWTKRLVVLFGAFLASLMLDLAFHFDWLQLFDLVRRLPTAALVVASLLVFSRVVENGTEPRPDIREPKASTATCEWVRSAGNYVELHSKGRATTLMRATLTSVVEEAGTGFVRIHRRHAVRWGAVRRIEPNYAVLQDGTRLPIGASYRAQVLSQDALVP